MVVYQQKRFGFFHTSNVELLDLLKGWLGVSLAFGIVLRNDQGIHGFVQSFIIALIIVGTGFLLHEMGHKLVAQHYHFRAEFRSFDQMLFLAIIMSFIGYVFAAPGAVMIQAHAIDPKRNGKISITGPLINILLAILFLTLASFTTGFLGTIAIYGFRINSWLALFNMIPFWLFDGAKVWRWNKIIWGTFVLFSLGLVFLF